MLDRLIWSNRFCSGSWIKFRNVIGFVVGVDDDEMVSHGQQRQSARPRCGSVRSEPPRATTNHSETSTRCQRVSKSPVHPSALPSLSDDEGATRSPACYLYLQLDDTSLQCLDGRFSIIASLNFIVAVLLATSSLLVCFGSLRVTTRILPQIAPFPFCEDFATVLFLALVDTSHGWNHFQQMFSWTKRCWKWLCFHSVFSLSKFIPVIW